MTEPAAPSGPDQTRPLALGYIQAHPLMTNAELAAARGRLLAFAHAEGYTLGSVFVEQPDAVPAAFNALLAAIRRHGAVAVVIPTIHHLAAIGDRSDVADRIHQHTGAHLLIAGSP